MQILVKCDNHAFVQELNSLKTCDPFLAACVRNIWKITGEANIGLTYADILGKDNGTAVLLSRWQNSAHCFQILYEAIQNPVWITVSLGMLDLGNTI